MKTVLVILLMCLSSYVFSQSDVWVDGYYRKNGTYVEGYWRTAPNGTKTDNYSTKGNVNPYTGQQGYVNPNTSYSNYTSQPAVYTTYAPQGTTTRYTVSRGTYTYRSVNGTMQTLPNYGLIGNWINKTLNNIHDKRMMRKGKKLK